MSCAASTPRWLTKGVLAAIFDYPFGLAACRMVVLRVAETNNWMRDIALRLGCMEYLIDDLRAEGEAEVIYTLKKTAWQNFIGVRHG